MDELYRNRRAKHFDQMFKYLRLVLNDHLLIACMFLFGGVVVYYSAFLKTLPQGFLWGKVAIMLIMSLYISFGNLATLIKEADQVFLLPKETRMGTYLRQSVNYSLILPTLVGAFLSAFLLPLMQISMKGTWLDLICFMVTVFFLKRSDLIIRCANNMQESDLFTHKSVLSQLIIFMIRLVVFGVATFVSSLLMVLLALLVAVFYELKFRKILSEISFDWKIFIEREKIRVHGIYRFFSLFTDVPDVTSKVRRRKFLDPLLQNIKFNHENTFLYLYARTFLRGTEYSGLVVRLSVLGALALIFISQTWYIAIALAVLFLYLIGFQMLPMYSAYDYMSMTKLYPVDRADKIHSLSFILTVILSVVVVIFSVISLITFADKLKALLLVAVLIVEELLFTRVYASNRLQKFT